MQQICRHEQSTALK